MRTLALVLSALLAGCATEAERAAEQQRQVDEMVAVYGPACEKRGYKGDSDPWRNCVLSMSSRDRFDRYSRGPITTNCFRQRGFLQCTTF
jgi:hypothetical protein